MIGRFSRNLAVSLASSFGVLFLMACQETPTDKRQHTDAQTDRIKKMFDAIGGVDKVNVPIRFYGKIVDQFGEPVEGVQVPIVVHRYAINSAGLAMDEFVRVTDKMGRFSVEDEHGFNLSVEEPKKSGYEFSFRGIRLSCGSDSPLQSVSGQNSV